MDDYSRHSSSKSTSAYSALGAVLALMRYTSRRFTHSLTYLLTYLLTYSMVTLYEGSGRLKMAVRLHNNRVQLYYPRSRFPVRSLQVVQMKSVPVFDGEWHTLVLSVTAQSVTTRTDCRKRKRRRLLRPFPTLLDIRFDEVHLATCGRRASERFRVRNFTEKLTYGSGTDSISLLIVLICSSCCCSSCWGVLLKCLRFRRFKSDRDEVQHDCTK